jgi:hypothetical protein
VIVCQYDWRVSGVYECCVELCDDACREYCWRVFVFALSLCVYCVCIVYCGCMLSSVFVRLVSVSLPEWSKGLRSGRNVFERVGSNPTADIPF